MRQPNIVLVVADDMGYGDFSCFNGALSRTPTLDQLVEDGVCLTQHYSASPVCAPARASLLTGRYPHRTGAIDTLEGRGLDRLALDERTLADLLGGAGYVTGLIGKWHNGALDDRYHPNRRGFAEFAGFSGGWQWYWDWRLDRNGSMSPADGRYLTDVLTSEAVDFIGRHRHEPFFLLVAYNAPHFPFQAKENDAEPFRESGQFTEAVSQIYGMILAMDRGVAALLDALEGAGVGDDTLFIFTSDNGPQFGGVGELCTDRFNCGFRGAKGSVYDGGIRLPLVARWPSGMEGGRQVDQLVHFTDWLPTLLAAAGVDRPPADLPLDGVNALPVLVGSDVAEVPDTRFWQWNRYTPVGSCNAAMRDGRWKLVRPAIAEAMALDPADLAMDVELKSDPGRHTSIRDTPEPERVIGDPPPPQLFDIAADPAEEHDLAADEPDRVRRMDAALGQWFEEVESERRTRTHRP